MSCLARKPAVVLCSSIYCTLLHPKPFTTENVCRNFDVTVDKMPLQAAK